MLLPSSCLPQRTIILSSYFVPNLVSPVCSHIHLSILIFWICASFTGQHSAPYNSVGSTHSYHIIPQIESLFHPPLSNMMDNIIVDFSSVFDYRTKILKTPPLGYDLYIDLHFYFCFICYVLNLHSRYSVLVRLNLKPLDSMVCLLSFSLWLIPLHILSIKTMSSANNMHHDTSRYICLVNSSITMANRNELRDDSWCNPHHDLECSKSPLIVLTRVLSPTYVLNFPNASHMYTCRLQAPP